MRKEIVTQPVNPALTLTTAKLLAHVNGTSRDNELQELLNDSIEFCKIYTGRAFIDSNWDVYYDYVDFNTAYTRRGYLDLDTLNVNAITDVFIYDSDGNESVLDSDLYYLTNDRIVIKDPYSLSNLRSFDTIRVNVDCGYGADESDVPDNLKTAISFLALFWMNNKVPASEASFNDIPYSVKSKLNSYRKYVTGVI